MQTVSQILANVRQRAEKAAEEAQKELVDLEQIQAVWPADVPVSRVHPHVLYGATAGVVIGDKHPRHDHESRATLQDVGALLDRLPPVPVYKVSDGCTSFRPETDVDDKLAMSDQAELCWGVTLKAEPGINSGGTSQAVEWYTQLGNLLVEVEVILRPSAYPVLVATDVRTDRRTGRVLEVKSTTIKAKDHFWLDQRVKWGAGSSEYANKFSCYWLAIDDSQGAGKAWLEQICGLN